jgi:pimeloyl-ACP methyl ester carboxylesterase
MDPAQFDRADRMIGDVAVTEVGPTSTTLPPVVMVHGGHHGAWCWQKLQLLFAAAGWRTTALDWLNHGRSAALPRQTWVQRDILAVREEVGTVCSAIAEEAGRPPVLIGHSMGGLASLAYATLDAPMLGALVLLAPVVPEAFASETIDLPVDFSEPYAPPPLEVARQLFFADVTDDEAERYYAKLQPESPACIWQATRWTAELAVEKFSGLDVLAFGAELDPLVPAPSVEALAAHIGADYVPLAGTGHGLTLDPVHAQVARTTLDWLHQRFGGGETS